MVDMELTKAMRMEDCFSFAVKESCMRQTHDLQSSREEHTVWVKMKLRDLVLVGKNNRKNLRPESNSLGWW